MTDNLKTAFDSIRAEDNLKASTLLYLHGEIQKQGGLRTRRHIMRYAAAIVSVAVLILSGVFSYNLYFTPNAYVDVDVNPSIALTLNQFDRVIGIYAYNGDGEDIISNLKLKHKKYGNALIVLIENISKRGYIQNDGLISVTLQTDNSKKEIKLVTNIQSDVAGVMAKHHHTTQVDVFSVSGDTRNYANEQGISPAKYLAIQELMKIDPTASVENCRDHSINEIKQLTQEHTNSHHSEDNTGSYDEIMNDESIHGNKVDCEPNNENSKEPWQDDGYHGKSSVNSHHYD